MRKPRPLETRLDPGLFPRVFVLDASVLIGATEEPIGEKQLCREVLQIAAKHKMRALSPAPVFAEVNLRPDADPIPLLHVFTVVPFDRKAALAVSRLPASTLKATKGAGGVPWHYIKYDAMIVGCAARFNATHIFTLDKRKDMLVPAEKLGIEVVQPSEFLAAQTKLFPNI